VAEDALVEKTLKDLLHGPLAPEAAVKIALLGNRSIQEMCEDFGITQADLVQAGLLTNPLLFGRSHFPTGYEGDGIKPESGVVRSFLDILNIVLRRRIASGDFEQKRLVVAKRVLDLALEVRAAYYTTLGAAQIGHLRQRAARLAESAVELARSLHAAGKLNGLDLANEEAAYEQAKQIRARAEADLLSAREKLTGLLGPLGKGGDGKAVDRLPEVPKKELAQDYLESLAVARRLDLAAERLEGQAIARDLDVVRANGWPASLGLGVDAKRERPTPWVVSPRLSHELPLLNLQQALIFGLESQLRQNEARFASLATAIRSEVRSILRRLQLTRSQIEHLRDVIIPLRERILKMTQDRYNSTLASAVELSDARQKQVDAYQQYIEATRDYWLVRSELERLTDGDLP
jgi:cobalt-zinc-cadmium efflux system outer membrane protein